MALLESMDADIHDNTFEKVKYGIRLSLGSARNNIYSNSFDNCTACEFCCSCKLLLKLGVWWVLASGSEYAHRESPAWVGGAEGQQFLELRRGEVTTTHHTTARTPWFVSPSPFVFGDGVGSATGPPTGV